MSVCGPDCKCGIHDKAPKRPVGCVVVLRDGSSHQIAGLSVTQAKFVRRNKGVTGYVKADGTEVPINGKQIKQIIPLP